MKENFKRLSWALKLDPVAGVILLLSFAYSISVVINAFLLCTATAQIFASLSVIFLLSLIVLVTLYFCCWRKRLSMGFICISYGGFHRICEKPSKRQISLYKKTHSCEELLDREIAELTRSIPIGRAVAITHGYVIEHIKANKQCFKDVSIASEPAYEHDLRKLHDSLFDCKNCAHAKKQLCRLAKNVDRPTKFYYIQFEKTEEPPNPQC